MAEGIEGSSSSENNSASGGGGGTGSNSDAVAMLSAVIPKFDDPSITTAMKPKLIPETARLSSISPTIDQQRPMNLKSETHDRHPVIGNDLVSMINENKINKFEDAEMAELRRANLMHDPSSNSDKSLFNGSSLLDVQKIKTLSQNHETSSSNAFNSPLNLSLGASSTSATNDLEKSLNILGGFGTTAQLPQLILASGQLAQGIQGAQLLIPTPQGLSTQTILTIPVSQQITAPLDSSENNNNHLLNPNLLSNGVQQLLSALHPQLFTNKSATCSSAKPRSPPTVHNPTHSPLSMSPHQHHTLSPKAPSPSRTSSSHHQQLPRDKIQSPFAAYPMIPGLTPDQSNLLRPQTMNSSPNGHQPLSGSNRTESPNSIPRLLNPSNGELSMNQGPIQRHLSPSHLSTSPFQSLQQSSNNHLPLSIAGQSKLMESGSHRSSPSDSAKHCQPSPMRMSPIVSEDENSNGDEDMDDAPNEPRINQTNCNAVDGIDIDEIKEFAKAFKLRRLSLGLTQTQVGQALSVTEGPAYSQSAICSALAAQMYAAQLSTQQQAMFEKLDITPKSAQKIKPVLERWMKEAEESHWNRYKTNQNHLTDFMGVEPSKKRKRRTSFTPQALELLNAHFERNTHPSGTEITGLAHQLGYEREVIRIWFCNKRQALKNTVRQLKGFEN